MLAPKPLLFYNWHRFFFYQWNWYAKFGTLSVMTVRLSKHISCDFYQWFYLFENISVFECQCPLFYKILSVITISTINLQYFISWAFISDHNFPKNISFLCYQWFPLFENVSVISYQWSQIFKSYQLNISVHW